MTKPTRTRPETPPLTTEELRRAEERARLPDGTVHPLLLGLMLAAPLGLDFDHNDR